MKRLLASVIILLSFYTTIWAQRIVYSEVSKSDGRDMNFEIIGKMNENILVYKNIKWNHSITLYDNDMKVKEKVKLNFVTDRAFNVDFITYPNFFYMIYQYQKKGILYCMGVKMDASANKIGDPIILDTTSIGAFADNKIYSTIFSEDKQKIMVFKIKRKSELFHITTILFDSDLKLIKKTMLASEFDDDKDVLSDFLVDNAGNFVFTKGTKLRSRDDISNLKLVVQNPLSDTFNYYDLNLEEKYIDEVYLKVDNLNKKYIITSLYYKQNRGDIEGLYVNIWDNVTRSVSASKLMAFNDSLRIEAKGNEQKRRAFNDYFIRQVIVRKDGGFLLSAESYSSQSRGGNPFNRFDYFNRYPFFSPLDYYRYRPLGLWYYRPGSSFGTQNVRYFYDNIMVISVDKNADFSWSNIIQKDQYDDDNDNYLSFFAMNSGSQIHFLFNGDTRNQIVIDQSINASGIITRNATLKSMEKGYEFMPKFSKQTGAKQVIIPCTYRGLVCFAKVDFD